MKLSRGGIISVFLVGVFVFLVVKFPAAVGEMATIGVVGAALTICVLSAYGIGRAVEEIIKDRKNGLD